MEKYSPSKQYKWKFSMANTGYIKLNQKDIVSVIQEETANKVNQSQITVTLSIGKIKLDLAKAGI